MEICCDTCPFAPTCEEIADFERDVLHLDDEDDDFIAYLPEGRVLDMLRYPDNRHLY